MRLLSPLNIHKYTSPRSNASGLARVVASLGGYMTLGMKVIYDVVGYKL